MVQDKGTAIAIGNFDGFHLGHFKILKTLKSIAAQRDLSSIVLTFFPNPRVYFNNDVKLIYSDGQKKRFLESLDVDRSLFLDFVEVLDMKGEDFVKSVLVDRFRMKHIVMGQNFKMGKNRDSDIESLRRMGEVYGFEIEVVPPVIINEKRISSSLIREKLGNAEIESANNMLGRMYCIEGMVVEGEKIGRQLGFPTINLKTKNTLLPEGVFKTKVEVDGKIHDSITNIGVKPTFDGCEKRVETHILNFNELIYGKIVTIFFERKIRDEIKFDSGCHLIKQIKNDIEGLKVDKGAFF